MGRNFLVLVAVIFTIFFAVESKALECHGTEPFWGATLSKEVINVNLVPDEVTLLVTSVTAAAGTSEEFIQVYSNENGPVAVVKSAECNNGMSDEIFPKEIFLFIGKSTLYGCCGEPIENL